MVAALFQVVFGKIRDGVKSNNLKHVLTRQIRIMKQIALLPVGVNGIILAGAVLKMDFLLEVLRLVEEEAEA